jgi:hypothetical protein
MRTEVREHHWDGLPNATMVDMTAQAAAPDRGLPSIDTFEMIVVWTGNVVACWRTTSWHNLGEGSQCRYLTLHV